MIKHEVVCDNCNKSTPLILGELKRGSIFSLQANYATPPDGITFENNHFCSYKCLGEFILKKQEAQDNAI